MCSFMFENFGYKTLLVLILEPLRRDIIYLTKKRLDLHSPAKIKLNYNYLIPYYKKGKKKTTTEDKIQKKLMKGRVEEFYKLTEEEILFDGATIIRMNNDLVYLVSNSGNYLGAKWLQSITRV